MVSKRALSPLLALLAGVGLQAQGFRQANPVAVMGSSPGWSVDDAQGRVQAVVPVAVLPGEIPIPLALRVNGSHQVLGWNDSVIDNSGPRPLWESVAAWWVDRPAWGAVHFGYMNTARTWSYTVSGATTTATETYTEPGVTVFEDGRSYVDGDWVSWSTFTATSPSTGNPTLPGDFGFASPASASVSVSVDGAEMKYSATASQLGSWSNQLTGRLNGFTVQPSPTYWVVMDRGKARVLAFAQELNTWLPVLWVDRFGHSATFTWTRTVSGLPSGVSAVYSMVADNRRSGSSNPRGIQLQWAVWSNAATVEPLLRADFIGVDLPSLVISGYSGQASVRPAGMVLPASDAYGDPYTQLATPDPLIGGLDGRPTAVQVGDRANLPQPAWAQLSVPAAGAGAPTMDTQSWSLNWDANHAALTSMTAPDGLTAQVTSSIDGAAPTPGSWSTHQTSGQVYYWRVDTLDETGPDGKGGTAEHKRVWTRTLPTASTGTGANWSVKLQDWWPSQGANQKQWTFNFGPYTQPTAYSSAALASVVLQDTAATPATWMTLTNTLSNMALNGSETQVTGQAYAYPKTAEPTVSYGSTVDPNGLRLTQSLISVGSSNTLLKQVIPVYDNQFAALDVSGISSVTTKLYGPSGALLSPTSQQVVQYDGGTYAKGLVTQSYQQDPGASGNQMGVTLAYDTEGRPSTQTNFALNGGAAVSGGVSTTTLGYDATNGWPASQTITAPSVTLATTVLQFDSAGRPLQVQDAKGVVTAYGYDLMGRVVSVSRPGSPAVAVTYSSDGLTRTLTQGGQVRTQVLDAFGRLVKEIDPAGVVTVTTYDAHGRVATKVQTPASTAGGQAPRSATWSYDPLDRPVSATDMDGVTTTTAYAADATGLLTVTTATNAATGLKVITTTNALGQTISTQAVDGTATVKNTSYTYNGLGKLATVTDKDASGVTQTRTFAVDGLGRTTQKTEPETGTQAFSGFNALGQPTTIQEGMSGGSAFRTRTLSYDGVGRLLAQNNGADNLTYTYTNALLTSASATTNGWTVSQTFGYLPAASGALLQTETTVQPDFSATLSYGYDGNGQIASVTYPDGRVVSYGRDGLARINAVNQQPSGGSLASVATVGYDPGWGFQSLLAFASGAQSVWSTKPDGLHLDKWRIQLPDGTSLDGDRLYGYDASKVNLSQAGEWSLVHDHLGRLAGATAASLGNYSASYGYDAFDNNTTATVSGSTPPQAIGFSFGALPKNQTPSTTTGGSATGWTYSSAGEATNFAAAPGSASVTGLQWDGLGRMSQVNAPGLTENEGYAPSGLRVRRDDSLSANSRRFVYTSGGLLLAEYVPQSGGGWQWNRDVVYLGSQAIAEVDGNGTLELHSDHLGTPRVITESVSGAAAITGRQNYGPYGETFPAMNSGYAPLTGYTGHVQTDPTGLIYMRGRFYTPIWHRFVNSDGGVDPGTWNQMGYVGGRPMMETDSSGMIAGVTICVYTTTGHWEGSTFVITGTDEYCYTIGGGGDSGVSNGSGGGTGGSTGSKPPQTNPCAQRVFKQYQDTVTTSINNWRQSRSLSNQFTVFWESDSQPTWLKATDWGLGAADQLGGLGGKLGVKEVIPPQVTGALFAFSSVWKYMDGITGINTAFEQADQRLENEVQQAATDFWGNLQQDCGFDPNSSYVVESK